MNLKNWSRKRAIRIILLNIVVLSVVWVGLSLINSFGQAELFAAPLARRGFIGLPDVSTFGVQNMPGATTHITVTESLSNGAVIDTVFQTIPSEAARFYTSTADLAYIEADQQIFGANFELSEKGNDAYLGLELIDSTTNQAGGLGALTFDVFLPYLVRLNNGWTTTFALQNKSETTSATVFVGFYDQSSFAGSETLNIPAGGSVSFDLGDMGTLPVGFLGSAVISADQEVAVASVRIYNTARGLRAAYPGVSTYSASQTLASPALFKNNNGQTSQVCVQNAGTSTDIVTVNYSDSRSAMAAIQPGIAHCFDQGAENHVSGWQGGAIISSISPLAVVVIVTAYENNLPVGRWSYTASATQAVGQAIALPMVFTHFEGNGGDWNSDIYLYNFGASPSLVTPRYSFTPDDFIYCGVPFTIPAGQMHSLSLAGLPSSFGPGMAYFSATQPVATASSVFDKNAALSGRDRYFGYEAAYPEAPISFPDSCDSFKNFLPIIASRN